MLWAGALAVTGLVACGGPPVPPASPPRLADQAPVVTGTTRQLPAFEASYEVVYSHGSPLTIDVHPPGQLDPRALGDVLGVEVVAWRLTGPPVWETEPEPLAALARQVLNSHASPGALPCLDLLAATRWQVRALPAGVEALADASFPARAGAPYRFRGVLPLGVSAGFTLRLAPLTAEGVLRPEGGRLGVRRLQGRELELALDVSRQTHRSVAAVPGLPEREVALLDPLTLPAGQALVIVVPGQFSAPGSWGYGVVLTLPEPPAPESAAAREQAHALEACVAALTSARPLAAVAAPGLPSAAGISPGLGVQGQRRAPLAALAAVGSAHLTADLVRAAREPLLESLAEALAPAAARFPPGPELGWVCEQTSFALLLEPETLPPESVALLRRFAGGAGVEPRLWLADVMPELTGVEALAAALAERNRALLRDASPATRCAAHAWLAARGLEILNYDPLGSREARRQALAAGRPR